MKHAVHLEGRLTFRTSSTDSRQTRGQQVLNFLTVPECNESVPGLGHV